MIIEILKKLVGNLIYLWSYVYSFKVKDLFGRVRTGLYLMWVRRNFKKNRESLFSNTCIFAWDAIY